ncbi:MAG: hypothetical protein QOF74_340, partial [Caballeronia mineralivorans]|nr:hypothetical protein [Caballeronia mineralivorans]
MPAKSKSSTKGGREKATRKLSATRRATAPTKRGSKTSAQDVASKKNPLAPRVLAQPVFSQPQATPDPAVFRVPHPSDDAAYKEIDKLNAEHKLFTLPFPTPRGGVEPTLTLTEVMGGNVTAIDRINAGGQLVFHATGDCGSTKGPASQNQVADTMTADFLETAANEVPQFALLLGDVVYNFGEGRYYYDQFYEPY